MEKQSGNALFLILIAIFLMGGLAALVSRTGSQSDDTGDTEQMQITATKILRYASGIETAIKNLLMRGCSENEISLWHDSNGDSVEDATDDNYNPNAPSDFSCHVFRPQGAGLVYKDVGTKIGMPNNIKFGTVHVGRALKGVGTDKRADLYMRLGVGGGTKEKMESFCRTVNRMAGIAYDPMPITTQISSISSGQNFQGEFFAPISTVFATTWRNNSKYFCIQHNSTTYVFAYVLLAR